MADKVVTLALDICREAQLCHTINMFYPMCGESNVRQLIGRAGLLEVKMDGETHNINQL
jgi:hypothetical protein